MQSKQIVYPSIILRLLSLVIDLLFLNAFNPILNIINKLLFNKMFISYPEITLEKLPALLTPEFVENNNQLMYTIFLYSAINMIIICIFCGAYFITFWQHFSCTPGKYFMRMRIVNSTDLTKPSLNQWIKRFLCYILSIFNVISMLLNTKNRGLHDKFPNTVVIKV